MSVTMLPELAAFVVEVRELDRRRAAGQEVRLLWAPETSAVYIEQTDCATGETTLRDVPPSLSLDAFAHPELYPTCEIGLLFTTISGEIEIGVV